VDSRPAALQTRADPVFRRLRRARRGRDGDAAFSDADYAWVTEQVKDVAERHAAAGWSRAGGGYALSALAAAWCSTCG